MATPQLSPGVITREVDLTVGRADNVLDNIGAIAGPFEIGPVDEATNIQTLVFTTCHIEIKIKAFNIISDIESK